MKGQAVDDQAMHDHTIDNTNRCGLYNHDHTQPYVLLLVRRIIHLSVSEHERTNLKPVRNQGIYGWVDGFYSLNKSPNDSL